MVVVGFVKLVKLVKLVREPIAVHHDQALNFRLKNLEREFRAEDFRFANVPRPGMREGPPQLSLHMQVCQHRLTELTQIRDLSNHG